MNNDNIVTNTIDFDGSDDRNARIINKLLRKHYLSRKNTLTPRPLTCQNENINILNLEQQKKQFKQI
jgi:hypothetical protein